MPQKGTKRARGVKSVNPFITFPGRLVTKTYVEKRFRNNRRCCTQVLKPLRSSLMRVNSVFARSLGGVFAFLLLSISAMSQAPAGTGTKLVVKSAVLGEDRTILVRTPPGYDTNKQPYAVMYMTDGDAHIGHTGSTIEFLARNGRMPELIVVGITNTDRTRDLTPTHVTTTAASLGNTPQFPTSGGADKFLKFIETELIPEIDKRYRVRPYRILAGHSFGGLFAVHAMLSRPALFNSYIRALPTSPL